jgi:hypothetical protein
MKPPEYTPTENSSNNETNSSKEFTRKDKLKFAGALGVLAVGYVGVFGGYIETRSLGPGTGHAEFSLTPKGRELIERTIDTMDSAADAVTGIFTTAPDENGETVEFIIEEDAPASPAE